MLYDSIGPNPRVVRIFMAERGIELPKTTVDLRGGENRQPPYLAKNPVGQMPCLELDDGSVIAEITAICEYLDEVTPGASLIGTTPLERAETRMWTRRIDLNIVEPMLNGFRFAEGLKLNDKVVRGQLIGYVGDTGDASGCHLHFEMWRKPGWYSGGSPFDPLPDLLAWDKAS